MQTDRGTNEYFGDEDEIQQERQEKEWQYEDGAYDYFKLEKGAIMVKDWTDAVWAISNISAIAGEFDTSSDEGRCMYWGSDDGYWLHMIICDEGKPRILINEFNAPTQKMWGVIGYCTYNNIHFEINESYYENEI